MEFDKKAFRLLKLFDRLTRGEILNRHDTAEEFDVSLKSIQRDIADINYYLAAAMQSDVKVIFSKKQNGYCLSNPLETRLTRSEVLDSRATAEEFGISLKSIQRDIEDINYYLTVATQSDVKIIYNRKLRLPLE